MRSQTFELKAQRTTLLPLHDIFFLCIPLHPAPLRQLQLKLLACANCVWVPALRMEPLSNHQLLRGWQLRFWVPSLAFGFISLVGLPLVQCFFPGFALACRPVCANEASARAPAQAIVAVAVLHSGGVIAMLRTGSACRCLLRMSRQPCSCKRCNKGAIAPSHTRLRARTKAFPTLCASLSLRESHLQASTCKKNEQGPFSTNHRA